MASVSELSRRDILKGAAALGAGAAGVLAAGAFSGCSSSEEEIKIEYVSTETESLWLYNPAGVREDGQYVDKQLQTTMQTSGVTKPPHPAESCQRVELFSTDSAFEEVTDLFYKRGWTDGLPIVPPDELRMIQMCRGTDLHREDVVAIMPPLMGQATVEKVAANAVMAGCRAEYLPILLAAVECVCDTAYDLVGVGTTTSPNSSLILVNGPIAKALNINSGANCLGRGHKANATISRALHLCEQNIGGSWPGVSDYSSLGFPGDFGWMLAENEDENPWEPYHVEQGYSKDQNIVTCISGAGQELVVDIDLTNQQYVELVGKHIALSDRANRSYLVVMPPYTAADLAAEGWDKPAMRKVITGIWNDAHPDNQTEEVDVRFVVAGGVGEKNAVIPIWRVPVSREVKLPANWDAQLTNENE